SGFGTNRRLSARVQRSHAVDAEAGTSSEAKAIASLNCGSPSSDSHLCVTASTSEGVNRPAPSASGSRQPLSDPYVELDPRRTRCRCLLCNHRRKTLNRCRLRSDNIAANDQSAQSSPTSSRTISSIRRVSQSRSSPSLRVRYSAAHSFPLSTFLCFLFRAIFCASSNDRQSSPLRHCFRRNRRSFISALGYFHLFSVIASSVASGLSVTAVLIQDASSIDPGGAATAEHEKSTTSRVNPLLRTQRETHQDQEMCHVWTKHSPEDLCSKGRWPRLRMMRQISLFTTDCSSEASNVQVGELFRLEWATLKSEADLLSHTEHLRAGALGRDCILGSARSDSCLRCFRRLDEHLAEVNRAFRAFNNALRRFDCTVSLHSSTATRPFSPNGTCQDCKTWYRKWLLVQLVNVWEEPPCINWCYYTQLACPYLAPSKVADFAGHPAFQCR
ncbi:NLF-1 protein, partial [Aphelenchoides avenae]